VNTLSQALQNEDNGRLSAFVARVSQLDEMQQRRGAP
jgi:hypothetical protein